ncbi:putative Protein chibby-like protein [Naja naja]|nr:putative Protein chibby-like protein [Naja naja]
MRCWAASRKYSSLSWSSFKRGVNLDSAFLSTGGPEYRILQKSSRGVLLGAETVIRLLGRLRCIQIATRYLEETLDRSTREIELGLEYGTPVMTLTGQKSFGSNGDRRETQRLRKRNQQLEEENNLLRLKVDLLLDMLSETTAESHLMEKELEELKNYSRRRK